MSMFKLDIITPKGVYEQVEIDRITLPSIDGQRTVLANHMALVIPIEIGIMFYQKDGKKTHFFVSEGLFTFEDNEATLLVNTVEREDEIDFNRAERAKERAEKRIQEYHDKVDVIRAEMALKRSMARLKLRK